MCILCVIQKWSRWVATMLPWLVIPLIGLWALSQLLPPAFRFEITSPRLACVFVLLVTLFWYEVLMPHLSAWRVRRNAQLRERKRYEAIELQKLRKTATKRCRNCLTPYKDQNPGGGKFMCSYCGHISKRPVLDLPVPPGFSSSGIFKDLVGRSGKLLNGKVWSDNGWMCGQDWVENGNWVGKSVAGKSGYWRNNENSLFGGDEHCFTKKSYSGIFIFACKLLTSFFLSIRWLWRKIFRVSTLSGDAMSDAEHKGMLATRDDGGVNFQESRGEKARRKAEEKRQARLERELLEEEEKKQREEVAKLVEERRKMRDEKMETEKDCGRISLLFRANESKKDAEKRRNERRKEKEKGFSKSYSDAEELEKRVGKDSDQKRDFDKKCKTGQQEIQKSGVESGKSVCLGVGPGIKKRSTDNLNEGNVGTRYLDRMRGTIWYSSKSFSGGSLFATKNTTIVIKENMSNSSVDPSHTSGFGRDTCPPESVAGKNSIALDDKNIHPVLADLHTSVAPKKSWQQLFTQSSSVPGSTNQNVISRPLSKSQVDANNLLVSSQASSTQSFENPLSFGLPSPFNLSSYPDGSINSNLGLLPAVPSTFPYGEGTRDFIREEAELFQDPCYIPNPVSLLGSVSESLDNFQLDMGTGFESGIRLEGACALENLHTFSEITKLSPIESPLSREKHNGTNWYPGALTTDDMQTSPIYGLNSGEKGTWQMWNSYPLGQEGLGIVGGPASWVPPPDHSRLNRNEIFHASSQRTMASLFTKDEQVPPGNHSPHNVFLGNGRSGRTFSPVMCSGDHNPWSQKALFPPFPGTENHFVLNPHEDIIPNELVCGERSRSDTNYPLVAPPVNRWFMNEWSMQGACEGAGQSSLKPPVGQFPNTNVQSSLTLTVRGMGFVPLWSS